MVARTICVTLAISWCVSFDIYAQDSSLVLDLAKCEQLAFKNNAAIRDAEMSLNISQAKLTQASHARFLPKFEMRNLWGPSPRARSEIDSLTGAIVSPDTSFSFSDLRYFTQFDIDLIQPIYTFGKLSGIADAARHGVEAEEANLTGETESVRLLVRQLYWGIVLGNELLQVVKDAEQELNKAETKIQEKLDEGSDEVSQTDMFKVQVFRYEVNKRSREAVDNIQIARSALSASLGFREGQEFRVANEFLGPLDAQTDSLSTYLEMALRHRPELRRLQAGINARGAMLTVTRSEYYPQFFLAGQLSFNYAKDRDDPKNPFIYNPTNYFRPGIAAGMTMNLNFMQTRDKVRVAQAEFLQLNQKEKLLIDGIKLDVQKTYLELVQAQQNMQESEKALKATDNWLRSTTMTFDIGVGEVKELIDAFRANSAMQAEHLQNIFKYNVAVAKLSKSVGRDLYPNSERE
jgi:outer membrane protein TolC